MRQFTHKNTLSTSCHLYTMDIPKIKVCLQDLMSVPRDYTNYMCLCNKVTLTGEN